MSAANWDVVAPISDGFSKLLGQANDKFLELGKIFPGAMVLDVACGTGGLAARCAALVGKDGRVIGIDSSKGMIDVAKQRHAALANLQLTVHDAHVLKLPDNSCDVVYCQLGLPFLDDPEKFLQRALAVLKPGGRLALMVIGARQHNAFLTSAMYGGDPRLETALRFADEQELCGLLERAGFEQPRSRPVRAACKVIDAAGYWDVVRGALGVADAGPAGWPAMGEALSLEIVFALGRKPDPSAKRETTIKDFHEIVGGARHAIRELTAFEVKRNLKKQDVVYLDIREPNEWLVTGVIPGALRIPRGDLEEHIGRYVPDPDRYIVVYSEDGALSTLAALTLNGMGYRNVWNLHGGVRGWIDDGLAVDKKLK